MAESGELNILIETGTDFVLPFTIYDNNGNPLDLTGATVESQLREYAEAYDFFEFACVHNGSGGRITVTMPHETTAQIPFTHGVYDVKVTLADGTISHPLSGEAYIKEGVTKSSDGAILFMLGINSFDDLPEVGNVDRLYFVYSDRRIYRWNGSNYVATSIGNGIRSIDFIEHVDEFSDKYRVTFDDLTTWDYIVTSKGIDYIEKVGSTGTPKTGVIDQYRIHFNNSTTHDYYVTNGRAFDVKTSYDATQAYEYLDMVRVNGATYVAVQDVPANTSISNTDYWLKIFAPLTIGTVSTVSAETGASASIGGTPDAPTLNLSIPRGVTGNESIDDTKGAGDTDYVWSADKVHKELDKFYYHVTTADAFYWRAGIRVNSSLKYGSNNKYAAVYPSVYVPQNYLHVYRGTTFSANEGYTLDYVLYKDITLTTRIVGARDVSSGVTITIQQEGYLLLAVSDGETTIDTQAKALTLATNGLNLNIVTKNAKEVLDENVVNTNILVNRAIEANTATDLLKSHIVWAQNIAAYEGYQSGVLNDDETITENSSYRYSVYIPIKPNTEYINRTTNTKLHLYDYQKNPIQVLAITASSTFTTPANAVYFRMCTNASLSAWQINEGDELLEYTKGEFPVMTADTIDDVSPYFKGLLTTNYSNLSGWYEVINTDYSTHSFSHTTTYSEIIALFDNLVADGDGYVTKNSIGTAEGTDSGGNVYTIYEYTFKPKARTGTNITRKAPKLLMDGSIHGFEKNGTYALYTLCYDLVHNWRDNPVLTELRNHVELQIVPVSNPWGFDNDDRRNYNGVNLNRNFPSKNWELVPSGADKSGVTGPLDQGEAIALANWMSNNTDMLMYFNIHTNGHYYAASYAEANFCGLSSDNKDEYYLRLFNALARHIEDQTSQLSVEFDTVNPTINQFIGLIHTSADGSESDDEVPEGVIRGTVNQYVSAYTKMALSMTLEVFNGLRINEDETIFSVHGAPGIKACAEMLGNLFAKVIAEYSRE